MKLPILTAFFASIQSAIPYVDGTHGRGKADRFPVAARGLIRCHGRGCPGEPTEARLVVTADSWTAQYQPGAEGEFFTAASDKLPPPKNDQVSIQCYNGPPDAEHWIRFDDFRILKLSD